MDFSDALNLVKTGKSIARSGWNGKGMEVAYSAPFQEDWLGFLAMKTVQGKWVPWLASQTDILAEDWQVVE